MSCGKEWQIQCEHVVCREAGDTFGRTEEKNLYLLCLSEIGIGYPSFVPKTMLKSHSWRPTTSHKAKWAPIKEFCILTQKGVREGGTGECDQNVIYTYVKLLKNKLI